MKKAMSLSPWRTAWPTAPGAPARLSRASRQEFIDYGYDDEDVKDELRDYGKDTVRIPPDKNGRITLPEQLIRYAGFSDKVVVVGVGEYAELWSEDRLVAYEAEREELKAKRRAKKDRERKARLAALAAESED